MAQIEPRPRALPTVGTATTSPNPVTASAQHAADRPLRELHGVVERITYQNPDNGYTVARLVPERAGIEAINTQGEDRLVTIVGTLSDLTPGEAIVAHGWWHNDARYGWQLTVVDFHTTLPATVQGMKKYLGSGLVKGIGPIHAGRIVDTFGEDTFAIIDDDPRRLQEVAGIGPVRAGRIATTWVEQRHIREVMTALQGFGISTSLAVRIYKRFGDQSGHILTTEPYRLAREVWGIGFKTADKIAQAVGIAADAPERLQAGALHALGAAADQGHTLLPQPELIEQATDLLGVAAAQAEPALEALLESGEIVSAVRDGEPIRLLALTPFARAESGLASRLLTLAAANRQSGRAGGDADDPRWKATFVWLAKKHSLMLAPEQEAAVRMALTTPVSLLTGGPGTGKTHTLRAVVTLAQTKGLRCLLAAPTGRAAKRMEDATGLPAATLHRLLELRPAGRAGRGPDNPLEADLVIVDEVSMLDVLLANQLVKALPARVRLLLVGDPDQLPSVGAGEVLADLLRCERFPITRLEHIFRQGAGSGIAHNAARVREGQMPDFDISSRDCLFVPAEDATAAAQVVVDLATKGLPARFGLSPRQVQILSPMHRGEAGVSALNTLLQERLNPARDGLPEARGGGRVYRPGDRVLQLKNDYDLKVFNGDLGTIQTIDAIEQELLLAMDDGREIRYPFASLYAMTHAYAISVHKAQGAEFPAVVIPLLTSHAAMLGRTLLYTALTRAQRLVVLVGQKKALGLAVRDWRRAPRHTALAGLLSGSLHMLWQRGDRFDRAGTEEREEIWEGLLDSSEPWTYPPPSGDDTVPARRAAEPRSTPFQPSRTGK